MIRHSFLLAAIVCLTLSSDCKAAPIYNADFTGADGSMPAGWTVVPGSATSWSIQDDAFRSAGPFGTSGSTVAYYATDPGTGNYTIRTNFTYEAPTVIAANSVGVVGRYADSQTYYSARVARISNEWRLMLVSRLGTSTETTLDYATLENSPLGADLQLVFSLEGTSLKAWLYDAGNLNTPLAQISATDSSLQTGLAGLRTNLASTPSDSYYASFGSFEIAPIPEPTAASLLLLMGLGATAVRWRWRKG